jgi:hypothetical protein
MYTRLYITFQTSRKSKRASFLFTNNTFSERGQKERLEIKMLQNLSFLDVTTTNKMSTIWDFSFQRTKRCKKILTFASKERMLTCSWPSTNWSRRSNVYSETVKLWTSTEGRPMLTWVQTNRCKTMPSFQKPKRS